MTETIFKDMNAFEQGYVPKDFIHREGELKEIAFCLEPAFRGYQATSAKIYGEPATGKTTAVKIIFEEIKEKSRVACAYVNSSIYDTKFSIFDRIQRSLGLARNANRLDAVYGEIFNKLSRNEKSLIVALDDVNFLNAQTLSEVLLRILKANEEFDVSASVIAISSSPAFSLRLRPQVASVFSPREIFFGPYSFGEMYNILKQRCFYGFIPGAVSEDIVRKIASKAYTKSDLRLGIRLLKESGTIAEREGCKITEQHMEKALSLMPASASEVKSLSREELEILRFISERGEVTAGEIYRHFEKSTTALWKKIKKFERMGLIKAERFYKRGRSSRIACSAEIEAMILK